MPASEAERAEDADLARARVDRAHHRDEHDERLDDDDHAGHDPAERAELVDGVHAVLDLLLHGRDLGPGQHAAELGDDLLHRAVAAERGDLDHGDRARLAEEALRRAQVGDEQVVVLGAGRPQDAGDGELPAADGDGSPVLRPRAVAAAAPATSSSAAPRRPPVHAPPLLEVELLLGRTPMSRRLPALDAHGAEQLGRDDGDVVAVGDGVDTREVRLADLLRPDRHVGHRDAAVRERQAVGARRDEDVGAVGLEVVLRLHGERLAQGEQRHHGADAHEQAGDQERRAGRAAPQVAERDRAQPHDRSSGLRSPRVSGDQKYWAPGLQAVDGDGQLPPSTLRSSGMGLQPPVTTLIGPWGTTWPQLLHTMVSPSWW